MTRRLAAIWGLMGAWCAILLLFPGVAAAQPTPETAVDVCIAPVRSGDTARAMMAAAGRFECGGDQVRFGPGDFWVRSAPLPPATGVATPIEVHLASVWQRRATLWALYADGRAARLSFGDGGAGERIRLGAIFSLPLPKRGPPIARLLWKVEGSANLRGILLGATLATPAESARGELAWCAIYAGFAGLCLALLIYNVALWAAMRHRFQLVYCLMVAALLAYSASSSGALAWIFPQLHNNDRLRINYVALALAASAAVLFARSFFGERIFAGWLGRLATATIAAQIVTSLLFAALAPVAIRLLDHLYAASFVPMLAIVIPMFRRAARLRSRYLPMFAVAWGAPVLMGALRVAAGLHLIGWSMWLDNSTIVSMTFEALLSSVAIAYRIKLLSRERDAALEGEEEARALADADPLTGLLNRRAFLREAIGRPGEHVLMLADIDHFKAVNDTLGHDGGDEVLRVVARALRGAGRAGGLVARIGGEEFAVLIPADFAPRPDTLVEHVRAERMPFDVTVTISVGSCAGPLATELDWKVLYRRADRALYEAKAAGRDRARAVASVVAA